MKVKVLDNSWKRVMISRVMRILTGIKSFKLKGQCSCDIITGSDSLGTDEACSNFATHFRGSQMLPWDPIQPFPCFYSKCLPQWPAHLALNHKRKFWLLKANCNNKDALTQMGKCWICFESKWHGNRPGKIRKRDKPCHRFLATANPYQF